MIVYGSMLIIFTFKVFQYSYSGRPAGEVPPPPCNGARFCMSCGEAAKDSPRDPCFFSESKNMVGGKSATYSQEPKLAQKREARGQNLAEEGNLEAKMQSN